MNKTRGFTIVELLIVIVVVAILAAITVVAFNGIQARAKNTKTLNAASSWIKAIKLYQADKGVMPPSASCLGTTSTYIGNSGQCWNDPYWVVRSAFMSDIQPYISNPAEPDTTDIENGGASSPRRGLMYNTDNSTYWRLYVFQSGTGPCPNIGIPVYAGPAIRATGFWCEYNLN